jgi:hypothetical protein
VRTAGLLYGRVSYSVVGAPNGIRTRVAALKGRNPRPLDDGGASASRALLIPLPPEGSRDSIATHPIAPGHEKVDQQLEDVTDPRAGEEQSAGGEVADRDDLELAIQEHQPDRPVEPERMHRARAPEKETVEVAGGGIQEPAHALAVRLGDAHPEHRAGELEDHRAHRVHATPRHRRG